MIKNLYQIISLLMVVLSQSNCSKILHFKPKYNFFNGSSLKKNIIILEPQKLTSNESHNVLNISLSFKFLIEVAQPQPIFWSSEISFWIDSIYYQVAIIRFGKCEHLIPYGPNLLLFQWNHIYVHKQQSDSEKMAMVIWNHDNLFKLDMSKCDYKVKTTLFNSFIIGGYKKKIYNERFQHFQGKISDISFSSLHLPILDSDKKKMILPSIVSENVFDWNLVKTFRHIGKNVDIIEVSKSKENTYKVKKLFEGQFDFHEASLTCYFLRGILSTDWKGINLYMWSTNKTEMDTIPYHSGASVISPETIQNSICKVRQISIGQDKEVYCYDRHAFGCELLEKNNTYYLRGTIRHIKTIDRYFFRHFEEDSTSFYGSHNTFIKKINSTWFIGFLPLTIIGFYNGSKIYPRGTNTWYIRFKEYQNVKLKECLLSFSRCDEYQFACDDGSCVTIDKTCDGNPDCSNYEDEKNCSKIETFLYRKEFPPSTYEINSMTSIRLKFHLNFINYVDEMNNLMNLKFGITLTWYDPRLRFHSIFEQKNYISEEEKQKIWIPKLIFKRVSGPGDFFIPLSRGKVLVERKYWKKKLRNNIQELYSRVYFNGTDVSISYSFHHEINLLCFFQFHDYPFDTQTCQLEILLPTQYRNQVHYDPNPAITTGNIKLLQMRLSCIQIECKDQVGIVTMTFKRIFPNILWRTYIPTFFLQMISILTLFLPRERFATSIMITLTTTLVMYSLNQGVSIALPSTSYNKMIDHWLLFAPMAPFFTFVIQITIELRGFLDRNHNNPLIIFVLKHGRGLLIFTIFVFDILYWIINLISYYSRNYNCSHIH